LHVIPPNAYAEIESGADPFVAKEKIFRSAEAALTQAVLGLRRKTIPCAYEIRRCFPVDQIAEFIHEHNIERLILGTSSRGKAGKFLLGSVAEELIPRLDIPFCIIGPNRKPFLQNGPHRLIFATSLHRHPDIGFQFADDLAMRFHTELTILHVVEQSVPDLAAELRARARIDEMLERVRLIPRKPRIRIRFGDPATEILAECSRLRPQGLILAAVPAPGLIAIFRAGVAYEVIAKAPCPTFTLRDISEAKGDRNGSAFSAATVAFPSGLHCSGYLN
jgi:nucleotide-binding universal stress UspA family protein